MALYQLDDDTPDIHATAWVADSADVVGRVRLAENASVWYGAVLRGDRKSTRLNSSHLRLSRMPSSA